MIAESLFFRLSLTSAMSPKRTNCAPISAASSRPTTEVKSQSHSSAATAWKQYRFGAAAGRGAWPDGRSSTKWMPRERSWY
jgi:hypothetical protein